MTVKVGDKIRIIDADPKEVFYKNGDIFYVSEVWPSGAGVDIGSVEGTDFIELYNREFEVVSDAFATPEIPTFTPSDLNGKQLRIHTGTDVDGDFLTHITVGIDEATGVMYVLGMKTEVNE